MNAGAKPVALAVIIGAHGVTGEVRLKLFSDGLDSIKPHTHFNGGALTLKSIRPNNGGALARFAEISDRNAAEAARGTELTVARSALPPLAEGEFYYVDMIGLPVESDDGALIGTVCAVENFGAGDIAEIIRPDGGKFMVPLNGAAARDWDSGTLIIAADFIP